MILVVSLIVLVMFMAAVAVYLIVVNRASTKLLKERDAAQSALRGNIHQLEETNRELEQFAYVASHDLREPLRMVTSYMSLLARRYSDRLDKDAREFIGFARDGAKRLDNLVLDLLEFSRINRHGEAIVAMPAMPSVQMAITNLGVAIKDCAQSNRPG